jgi:alpha/beta superfamily hydrolase
MSIDPTPGPRKERWIGDVSAFLIPGPVGPIEGRLEVPVERSNPRFLALFAHPHPRLGGTMQNPVVVHGARALARLGGLVARFNFRGVGRSGGKYDEGRGERDDVVAVAEWLRGRRPEVATLVAAGFSFGSIRALEACAGGAADRWLGVAPPLTLPQPSALPRLERPAALVLAGADELAPPSTPAELSKRFADLRAVETVAGAGHLFIGRIGELAAAVAKVAEPLLER